MNIADLLNLPELKSDLSRLDEVLHESVVSDHPFLSEVATHLISAGGKRLRPWMAIAAAQVVGSSHPVDNKVIQGGAAVELVHIGSLYHDDVLDRAQTRRTVPSVNAKYGNFMAIIAGDYLLARASAIAASLGTEVTGLLAQTISALCEGQVWEHRFAFDPDRTVAAYDACIAGKTASLIAAAAQIGALTAGGNPHEVEAIGQFAHAFGMAFQIRDDILDVTSTNEELGKPSGNDLVEGIYTLPVIFALQDEVVASQLRPLLGKPLSTEERDFIQDIVRASSGVDEAVATGLSWTKRANASLQELPNGAIKKHLSDMADDLFADISAKAGSTGY